LAEGRAAVEVAGDVGGDVFDVGGCFEEAQALGEGEFADDIEGVPLEPETEIADFSG
jgi:hypothetical protein